MGCITSSQRNSPRAPASRARQGDNAATGRAGTQAGGTRTMTAYPDESLRIQGRATGQGNWQADRAAITNVRLGAQQLLRDTASTLDENSPLRSRLRQLLATIALQLEGNQFFLPPEQYEQQLSSIRQDLEDYRADNPTAHEIEGRVAYTMAFHDQNFDESAQLPTAYDMGGFHAR